MSMKVRATAIAAALLISAPTTVFGTDSTEPVPAAASAASPVEPSSPEALSSSPPAASIEASGEPTAAAVEPPLPKAPSEAATATADGPGTPALSPEASVVVLVRELLGKERDRAGAHERADRAALAAFYQSAPEKLYWTTMSGLSARGRAVVRTIERADDWGLNRADFDLPRLPDASDGKIAADALAQAEIRIGLAALKYARHARGGRAQPSDLSNYLDRKPPLLDPAAVLSGIATSSSPDGYLRALHPRHPQFELLRQKYVAARSSAAEAGDGASTKGRRAAPASGSSLARRILLNMEQWRWMPEDLGAVYVTVNVPEFTLRVVKAGVVAHEERVIVGKADTQTPIFSDEMDHIVFHPFWGVPDSIKIKEIWPSLARGGNVLGRHGLRLQRGGRDVDPESVDWSTADIRNFHVYQPPGGDNVLGVVKFMFPNRHQVYMHDTPTKHLFAAKERAFSHGCMRVRDPMRLAQILLANDKGWAPTRVASLVTSGPQNNQITLDRKVPVHITYFTMVVDGDGRLQTFPDIYGHEQRIQLGLEGKAHLIVKRKEDLKPIRADAVARLGETGPAAARSWVKKVFSDY